MTRMADRLERGGFVRRGSIRATEDRVVLRAVPERVGVISRYYQSMGDRWQRQIEGCSDAELRFLVEFLRRGRENTQVETARLRAEGARTAKATTRTRPGDALKRHRQNLNSPSSCPSTSCFKQRSS